MTAEDVRAFYKADRARTSDGTAHTYIVGIRSFYNWLQKAGKIRENPVAALGVARVDAVGRKEFCTPALRDKLIAEAPTEELRMILFLGFHVGLRKNEIIQARPEWFDLVHGSVNVRASATFRPKDREERTIPLTKVFRTFLSTYGLPSPFVLRPEKKSSASLYRFSFKDRFNEYMEAQGCPWVTPHVMRHTMASLLASAGVSIYKIALWLGDEVKTTQKHYAKLLPGNTDIEKAFTQTQDL